MSIAPLLAGACKADYDIGKELGRGSYGVVHFATRKRDSKSCVIKKVALQTFKTDKQKAQALNEAKIMKNLNCVHVVAYLDAFNENEMLYISLEFCDGGDLKGYLKKNPDPLEEGQTWRLFLHITLGMVYLHSRRILHRDLKSENVLLHSQPKDGVRIADLGLSKMLTNTASGAETLCGTPRYLSPEEATGKGRYNQKSDIWALGVIHYELLSKSHRGPFDEANQIQQLLQMIVNSEPPKLPDGLDPGLVFVLNQLMLKDSKLRPQLKDLLATEVVVAAASKHDVNLHDDGPASPEPDNGLSPMEMSGSLTPIGELGDIGSRPVVVAIGAQGYVWDPVQARGEERPVWLAGESLSWGGLGCAGLDASAAWGSTAVAAFGLPDVFWYLEAGGSAEIEVRRLRDGAFQKKLPLPLLEKEDEKGPAATQSAVRPVSRAISSKKSGAGGLPGSVSMAASGGFLLALAIDKGASNALVVIELASGSAAGRCTSEIRITALAVQATRHGDPRPSCLAAGGEDSRVRVWGIPVASNGSVPQCELLATLMSGAGPGPPASVLSFGAAAEFLVSASNEDDEAMCVVWRRTTSGKGADTFEANTSKEFFDDYRGHGPASLFCDGNLLAYVQGPQEVAMKDHGVALWDLTQGRWERSFFKRGHHVNALALCGDTLITSDGDRGSCTIQLWQVSTGSALKFFRNPSDVNFLCVAEHVMRDPEDDK